MEIQIVYCFRLISGTFNCRRKVRMIVADHIHNIARANIAKMAIDQMIFLFFKWFHLHPVFVQEYAASETTEIFALRR